MYTLIIVVLFYMLKFNTFKHKPSFIKVSFCTSYKSHSNISKQ
jgi:hypothetical protein